MERFDLTRTADGYELFLSYVDPVDGRWRIDAITAARPERFDAQLLAARPHGRDRPARRA